MAAIIAFLVLSVCVSGEVAQDCTPPAQPGWTIVRQKHCCLEKGVCPPILHDGVKADFDCIDNLHNWGTTWSLPKKQWCCTTVGLGCSADVTVPPPPSSASTWVSYGDSKACRLDRADNSPAGDGNGTVVYKGYPFHETRQECKLYCESTWAVAERPAWMGEAPPKCTGIEWTDGHCETWTKEIGFSAPAAAAFECWHYSASPVTLQGPNDQKYFVVEPGRSVKATRFTARAQDVFHKLLNDDGTVSFLTAAGKFLSAEEDGSVNAKADAIDAWEKWTEVSHGDSVYSYMSWHTKFMIVLVDEGTVRATASAVGDRTKIRVNPIQIAGATEAAPATPLQAYTPVQATASAPAAPGLTWNLRSSFSALGAGIAAALVASMSFGLFRATRSRRSEGGNRQLGVTVGENEGSSQRRAAIPRGPLKSVTHHHRCESEQPLYPGGV